MEGALAERGSCGAQVGERPQRSAGNHPGEHETGGTDGQRQQEQPLVETAEQRRDAGLACRVGHHEDVPSAEAPVSQPHGLAR
ncbi:hypothetical protein [Luteitalea sp.]|uniref:hypothetical protein n=1 Tax=Luteitalea sp. TaxID=2004800 RepID=UPI0025C18E3B|nr:hypothetical protein [Luteitalea sp.]